MPPSTQLCSRTHSPLHDLVLPVLQYLPAACVLDPGQGLGRPASPGRRYTCCSADAILPAVLGNWSRQRQHQHPRRSDELSWHLCHHCLEYQCAPLLELLEIRRAVLPNSLFIPHRLHAQTINCQMTNPALYHAGAFQTLLQLTTRSMLFNQHGTLTDPVLHADKIRVQQSQQVSLHSSSGQHLAALQVLCGIDVVALCAEVLLSP